MSPLINSVIFFASLVQTETDGECTLHSELVYLSIPLDMHGRAYNVLTVKHISYLSTARIAVCVAYTEVSIINKECSRSWIQRSIQFW